MLDWNILGKPLMVCDINNLNVCFLFLFSDILAAHASFLWEINAEDDDEDDDSFGDRTRQGKEDFEVGFYYTNQ